MINRREQVQIGKQIQNNIALGNRTERQLLDHPGVASHLIEAQQFNKSRLGLTQMVDPDSGVDENHSAVP